MSPSSSKALGKPKMAIENDLRLPFVNFCAAEPFLVVSQGENYLEGYLAKKPRADYEALETELEKYGNRLKRPDEVKKHLLVAATWAGRLARGTVLSVVGNFVDVFLLDYGIREVFSKENVFSLPTKFHELPAYGVRIELKKPPGRCLIDQVAMITALRRISATSASGSLPEMNLEECAHRTSKSNVKFLADRYAAANGQGERGSSNGGHRKKHRASSQEAVTNSCARGQRRNGVESPTIRVKLPNKLLLEAIGTPCFLTRLKVMEVLSPAELLCSHRPSLEVVRNALDTMDEIPSKIPPGDVKPKMLVLVLFKATLHRGIVTAISSESSVSYRVEFIDVPGFINASSLYYVPSKVGSCAPKALFKVCLKKRSGSVRKDGIITLLCEEVIDNTAHGLIIDFDPEARVPDSEP